MFTGVIKLAQIDDYIAPSQNCIQPKIMKKDKQIEKATVTLNDCLACSGCITSAESILIQQMSINKFLEIANNKQNCCCKQTDGQMESMPIFIIMSPQSLLSLAKRYKTSIDTFMFSFQRLLTKKFKNKVMFFELSDSIKICHQLILQEFLHHQTLKQKNPIICSQCPGWVCYAQKTLSKQVVDQMSQVKSPQQILGNFIRNRYGNKCYIVSVAPCYDKKLQAIRFNIEEGIKQVDLTLATIQIVQLIKKITENQEGLTQDSLIHKQHSYQFQNLINPKQKIKINFLNDQTSNGYIDALMRALKIKQYNKKQIRNSDFQQYSFWYQGQEIKMAKCYGFRNIQKAVQAIKKNKCPYKYIEMMACPGGCFSGGGQVRYEDIKNKQIVQQFQQIKKKYTINQQLQISQQISIFMEKNRKYLQTKYAPIQKSLEQSVMNW